MQVLQLHMENDHQGNMFNYEQCNKKLSFKNQLKLHRRQDHEEGSFACFVCNNRFMTHKDLKQHMQRKCKSQNQRVVKDLPRPVNEDIAPEDEFRCTKCGKVTNNQVSFINHIKQKHQPIMDAFTGNKCVSCNKECDSRDLLVKHIEDEHIQERNIINRHICVVYNVEVHGDQTRDTHMCRKAEHKCSFCQMTFHSQEVRKYHICSAHQFQTMEQQTSNIRKEKCRPATTPTPPVYVTLRGPPLDSEMGWTGELWSNPVLLILEN